ncbi:hypothetical protein EZV73_09815 [Acidaminobacter sp. JC074]|uniref:hypothetical protein n=1 Tax=Acidaminobacter sp. JC074 TaxID=2530199 RepID=UPI001F0EE3F7|nr:hypothetical protein [Acidaminobacter sp. JC074]MCH4887870.1 hypothetical protein [Acidaminobacter sp. JC074]
MIDKIIRKINEAADLDVLNELVVVINVMISLHEIGKNEGLLALEEALYKPNIKSLECYDFLEEAVMMIVDGFDPIEVDECLHYLMHSSAKEEEDYLIYHIISTSVLKIQKGCNTRILKKSLVSHISFDNRKLVRSPLFIER